MKQDDGLRRFIFEQAGIRGEWVRLEESWQQAKKFQKFANKEVESQLGQALAAVVLLSATIKFKGSMILQVQGDGALKTLVAQASHDRKVRVLVRSLEDVNGGTLKEMMGHGRLVITVESDISEPYQGIVALDQDNLADLLQTYFQQSEQLETRLWLFANATQAVGLLLQELPDTESHQQDWQRISILANTLTEKEMLELDCETLLHRLFHEDPVRLFDPEPVEFSCNCSREKIISTLLTLGEEELQGLLKEQGGVTVDCQFCGQQYHFDKPDIENLIKGLSANAENQETRH